MKRIAVISAKRSPVGKIPGELNYINETKLISKIFKAVSNKYEDIIEEAILGSSFPIEKDNLCRKAVLDANLSSKISSSTISKTCASSDEALLTAFNKIFCGKAESILVGGIEKISNSSYTLHFMKQNIKKAMKGSLPYFADTINNILENDMVYICEMLSKKYNISRKNQDEFTINSIRSAKIAQQKGYFNNEIYRIGYKLNNEDHILENDEMLLYERTENEIYNAKPMFVKDGCITQYNAAPMCDCAAAILLMDYNIANTKSIKPLVSLLDTACIGVPKENIGFAMIECVKKILKENRLNKSDIDLFEINESFAAQAIFTASNLALDMDKVNVNGGNLALGYPIGVTGLRMSITLIHEMKRRNARLGLSVMCAGGNMANAVIYENIN